MRKGFALKPADSPEPDAAAELAAYFETPDYAREVQRQRGSYITLRALEARGFAARQLDHYWQDAGYAHAANIAAATEWRAS